MSKSVPKTVRHTRLYFLIVQDSTCWGHKIRINWSCQNAAFLFPSVAVNPEQQEYGVERDELGPALFEQYLDRLGNLVVIIIEWVYGYGWVMYSR